jgi:hypothetical protein
MNTQIVEINGEWFEINYDELTPEGEPIIIPIDPPGSPGA